MSSSDKTKQKLMETMRMTKSDSSKTETAGTKQIKTSQDDKTIKDKKKNTAQKKVAKDSQKLSVNTYQAARRVWPD